VGRQITWAKQINCSPPPTKFTEIAVFWDVTPCNLVPKEIADSVRQKVTNTQNKTSTTNYLGSVRKLFDAKFADHTVQRC
jgi:hypothetical protein